MSHEIEEDDQIVLTGGVPAWHGLGNLKDAEALTLADALEEANLARWNMYLEDVVRQGRGSKGQMGRRQTVEGSKFVVRGRDEKVLGVVGDRYRIVTNEEAFSWAEALIGGDGFVVKTAGSLRGGRIVWVLLKAPFDITMPEGGKADEYILLVNYHDGSGSVRMLNEPVKVVCANTMRQALGSYKAAYSIRHTRNAEQKLSEAQKVLGLAQGAADRLEKTAEALYRQKISERDMDDLLAKLLPDPGKDAPERTKTNIAVARNTIRGIYEGDKLGQAEIKGTAWGAFNAVGAYVDHFQYGRNTKGASAEENRFARSLLNSNLTETAAGLLLPA